MQQARQFASQAEDFDLITGDDQMARIDGYAQIVENSDGGELKGPTIQLLIFSVRCHCTLAQCAT